ncbi:MAG: hypothetical protein IAG10_25925, partial [Planctomycetaceae bacterium]|nr:hypothetical protein [Planctomycetaceae bacterium]
DQIQMLVRQEEQKQYTPRASSQESTLSFHAPEGSLAKAELVRDIASYAQNLEYPKITMKNPEAPAPVPPDGATKGIPDASASGLDESKKSGTERMMLDFICQEAYSHVERLKSLEYTFETKDAEGWHSKADFHADKVRFLINRQDVTGMWVIDKRLEPMSCSAAFNGLRQQYLDANHRLRLKTGPEGASYTNTTPQQYMFMWLRSGADDLRWDSIQNRELWQRRFAEASYVGAIPQDGRTLEIVDFPQKVDGVKPCAYRVFFARDLGFTPIKYIRRVSATTETSTTMEVTELRTIAKDSQEHVLPLALSITESRADGVSLKQRLTITVGEKSLKINEPLDESLFTINPALAKEIYDVDLQDALLKPKEK